MREIETSLAQIRNAWIAGRPALEVDFATARALWRRIEAMNFPNGEITESSLTYDFNNPTNPATDFLNARRVVSNPSHVRPFVCI